MDGPVTREALTVPEEVRLRGEPVMDPPRWVRLRVHAPPAKKSTRPQVGRRQGKTGAEAEDVRESDGPVVAEKSGNRVAPEAGGAKGASVDMSFRRDPWTMQ